MSNTRDLTNFGYVELKEAGLLLSLFKTDKDKSYLADGVAVEFNPSSGMVFLVDEDFNAAMEWQGELVNWIYCPECGYENYQPEFLNECTEDCCKQYFKEINSV